MRLPRLEVGQIWVGSTAVRGGRAQRRTITSLDVRESHDGSIYSVGFLANGVREVRALESWQQWVAVWNARPAEQVEVGDAK